MRYKLLIIQETRISSQVNPNSLRTIQQKIRQNTQNLKSSVFLGTKRKVKTFSQSSRKKKEAKKRYKTRIETAAYWINPGEWKWKEAYLKNQKQLWLWNMVWVWFRLYRIWHTTFWNTLPFFYNLLRFPYHLYMYK